MEEQKYVYLFNELNLSMKDLVGSKAANLAEMVSLGLPVPAGFVVTTEVCNMFNAGNKMLAPEIEKQIMTSLTNIEKQSGKKFGDPTNPLLVSVRSGARVSMPGMMSTILNIGMNDEVAKGLAKLSGNEWFAFDSYRRFVQMYMEVVAMLDKTAQEKIIDEVKEKKGIKLDTELSVDDLKYLIERFKANYKKEFKKDFPVNPLTQLMDAISAVFASWDNKRAILYRRLNDIPDKWGTGTTVQSMVFGNLNEKSGTGVAFSRNPSTGENVLYGEYLMNAQGEDVVAGVRTPKPISELEKQNPIIYKEFYDYAKKLEKHYKDMQDMEFTIENGKLYFLQTRIGKRTAPAGLKIAVDLVREGLITEKEAVIKIEPKTLDTLLHPQFDKAVLQVEQPIAKGLPASPGAASGKIVMEAEKAKEWHDAGEKVILVRLETSPEDIVGFMSCEGILTARGGMTSHAAVVARGMGKCCVSGCHELVVHEEENYVEIAGKKYNEGDVISLDGSTGFIYGKKIKTLPASLSSDFETIMSWADNYRAMTVRANVDTAEDSALAYSFGAEGVGLVRTEHMFFEKTRIIAMAEMIVASTLEERQRALAKLLPYQKSDFVGIYREMRGYPVTIRLLDPPLHEFLPKSNEEIEILAKELMVSQNTLRATIDSLKEVNPMMGHRGLRLAVTFPEIAKMQTQAIIEAALEVNKQFGYNIMPEIMIPLTSDLNEFNYVKSIIVEQADKIISQNKAKMTYKVGTMIEVPRAAMIADDIAKEAEFFSFGTNDLTQMTYGFSRDDAGKFLKDYYEKKIFEFDPFARVDEHGVGRFIEMAVTKGRLVRPDIKLGICGEHGGDPASVNFFHKAGLTYVSCSAYRVPIARLAAAQANIRNPRV